MLLYFTNNSKQKKILIKTDFPEDVYDEMLTFFESYHIYPHFIEIDDCGKISFGSMSEFFYVENASKEDIASIRELLEGSI